MEGLEASTVAVRASRIEDKAFAPVDEEHKVTTAAITVAQIAVLRRRTAVTGFGDDSSSGSIARVNRCLHIRAWTRCPRRAVSP
jgi:hypothetical protein